MLVTGITTRVAITRLLCVTERRRPRACLDMATGAVDVACGPDLLSLPDALPPHEPRAVLRAAAA